LLAAELVAALRKIEPSPERLVSAAKTNKDEYPLLLIVDSDRHLAERLVMELLTGDYEQK